VKETGVGCKGLKGLRRGILGVLGLGVKGFGVRGFRCCFEFLSFWGFGGLGFLGSWGDKFGGSGLWGFRA